MKIPKLGTIISLAILGGLGYAAYKFARGDWKLPSLPSLPPLPTPDPQTLKETGIVGGLGDVIYNITMGGGELRERVEERAMEPEIPFPKAVAEVVSEDIHEQGLGLALAKAPVTIGAGLGAMEQHERYLETLPVDERIEAERVESEKRLEFKKTPEATAARVISSIFPPLSLITTATDVIDVVRTTAPKPKPKPEPVLVIAPRKPLPEAIARTAQAKIWERFR